MGYSLLESDQWFTCHQFSSFLQQTMSPKIDVKERILACSTAQHLYQVKPLERIILYHGEGIVPSSKSKMLTSSSVIYRRRPLPPCITYHGRPSAMIIDTQPSGPAIHAPSHANSASSGITTPCTIACASGVAGTLGHRSGRWVSSSVLSVWGCVCGVALTDS